jgi:hypothetical protein
MHLRWTWSPSVLSSGMIAVCVFALYLHADHEKRGILKMEMNGVIPKRKTYSQ